MRRHDWEVDMNKGYKIPLPRIQKDRVLEALKKYFVAPITRRF